MNKKIVIVDDEPITRMDIRDILEAQGYDVVGEAADGFSAIEVCKSFNPDLVIMDIQMPVLDGLKASKRISMESLAGGILLLTAFNDSGFIEKAKNVGAFGYLVKPLDEKSFIPTIEMCLSKVNEFKKLRKDLDKANLKLDERKLVEKAKGILMKELNVSEDDSYKNIRKLSMDKRCSMVDIAKTIIIGYED
ncbi:ANTAR domain-containing response regulator [Clostridium frigidicarnis]|uniref:Stage 0 sporulation protein A homolog n=1 Tax=Clostridium frigidicarnis TaxID=84698 RepID=A0A1I0ZRG1_9CLOT|nr:response regulator [Clostridium frigidicarnis]SFB28314.1 response regulator receiver and ANTAR domain protein [Clostridium frigidicarnis]